VEDGRVARYYVSRCLFFIGGYYIARNNHCANSKKTLFASPTRPRSMAANTAEALANLSQLTH
jgi:hypothetical protein